MKKKLALLVALAVLALYASGCGKAADRQSAPQAPPGSYPQAVEDDTGRTVALATGPERIVSLMPSLTEILFALGLGDKVVGVTTYCNFPPEAAEREKVGGLYDLNAEKIIALAPDLVLSGRSTTIREVLDVLEQNDLIVALFDPQSLNGIEDAIVRIATLVGVRERGEALAAQIRVGRDAVAARVAALEGDKPTVFVLLDTDYIYTVGDGEFLSEMITVAGGTNAASGLGEGWLLLSEETLFELDPDIIILTYPMRDVVMAKAEWNELSAVKSGRVYDVDGDLVSRPGPRVALGLEELYHVFHGQQQ